MKITPEADRTFVRITDERLPDCEWFLRIPEYGYRSPEDKGVAVRNVRWEIVDEGRLLKFAWEPEEDELEAIGVAWTGLVEAKEDEVHFTVTRKNVSSKPWPEGTRSLFCFMSRDAETFHDIDGVRSYALKNEILQSVNQLVNSRFEAHRMCGFKVRQGDDGGCERLMAKISRDGAWFLGIATDIAGNLSCNQQPKTSCLHSNPYWGAVGPGEEAVAKGKIYLVSSEEELLARYAKDFPA